MKHLFNKGQVLTMAVALVVLMAVGCKQNKPEPKETGFELALTNADSAAVVQLVDQFFGYAEHGGYTDAAAMIHKAYNNPDSVYLEPEPLDNQQLNRMIGMLKSLKIKSHHIDYIKFNQTYLNEVKCTVFLTDKTEGPDVIKTVFYFKPVDYMGAWKLCMMDSHSGDHTVIDGDKRDSMTNTYQQEMREKNLKKLKSTNSHK